MSSLRPRGETPEDQEGTGSRQGAAARIQEELRPVARVEKRPAARHVAANGLDGGPPDRDDAFLRPLPERPDDARIEIDIRAAEADGFADAEPGAVQQLDERPVAERPWRRSRRCVDESFRLRRRQRPRESPVPPREVELRGGVVSAGAEQRLVADERP